MFLKWFKWWTFALLPLPPTRKVPYFLMFARFTYNVDIPWRVMLPYAQRGYSSLISLEADSCTTPCRPMLCLSLLSEICSLRHVTFLAKRAFFLVKSVAFIMIYVAQLISLVTLPHVPFRSHSRCLAGGLLSHIAPLARWTLILCKICFLHIALLALRICNRFKFISLFEQNSTLKSTFGLLCRIYAPRRTWGTFFLKFWYSSRGILGWSCDSGLVAWIINYITS